MTVSKVTCFIFLTLSAGSLYAGSPTYSGKVTAVGLSGSSDMTATIVGDNANFKDVSVCNVDIGQGRFTATACKSLQSLLMAAKTTNDTVTMWFKEGDFTSCTQSWGSLSSQGFYHLRAKKGS